MPQALLLSSSSVLESPLEFGAAAGFFCNFRYINPGLKPATLWKQRSVAAIGLLCCVLQEEPSGAATAGSLDPPALGRVPSVTTKPWPQKGKRHRSFGEGCARASERDRKDNGAEGPSPEVTGEDSRASAQGSSAPGLLPGEGGRSLGCSQRAGVRTELRMCKPVGGRRGAQWQWGKSQSWGIGGQAALRVWSNHHAAAMRAYVNISAAQGLRQRARFAACALTSPSTGNTMRYLRCDLLKAQCHGPQAPWVPQQPSPGATLVIVVL